MSRTETVPACDRDERVRLPGTVYTIQALRGFAALLVVAQHTATMCIDVGRAQVPFRLNGSTGLDIFFVLSGFIMPLSIRRASSGWCSAQRFFLRRLERIVPLYWIMTTVKLCKDLLLPGTVALSFSHTVASYLFIPSRNALGEVVPLLPPGWTLNMEMVFYLLIAVALLLRAPLRFFLPPLLLLLACGVLLHLPMGVPISTPRLPLFLEFLFGMVLADRYLAVTQARAVAAPAWAATACLAASSFLLVFTRWGVIAPLIFAGPLALLLVGSAVELEARVGHRIPRPFLLLGDASYSIYLVHWFVIGLIRIMMEHGPLTTVNSFAVPLLLAFLMSIAAGLICYRWVESPINRYFHVRRQTATAF